MWVTTTVISSVIHSTFCAVSPNTTPARCVRALEVILYATRRASPWESTISIGNYNGNLRPEFISDLPRSLIRAKGIRVTTAVFNANSVTLHQKKKRKKRKILSGKNRNRRYSTPLKSGLECKTSAIKKCNPSFTRKGAVFYFYNEKKKLCVSSLTLF